MLVLFVKFLRVICGVKEGKLTLNIQLFRSFNKDKTKKYWSELLDVPNRFISVNIHSDKRSKPDKQRPEYGITRIEARNVKRKQWIDGQRLMHITK
jgi:hypothetical protein